VSEPKGRKRKVNWAGEGGPGGPGKTKSASRSRAGKEIGILIFQKFDNTAAEKCKGAKGEWSAPVRGEKPPSYTAKKRSNGSGGKGGYTV